MMVWSAGLPVKQLPQSRQIKDRKGHLAACDVYRPAAIEQLQINGEKQGVEVFSMGNKNKPADIAKAAVEHAKKEDCNVLIIDTAGRLHVDEEMMDESPSSSFRSSLAS